MKGDTGMDSIERQAAIGTVKKHYRVDNDLLEVIVYELENLPDAQSEREKGEWIIDSDYPQHCWCSNCNHRFDLFDPKSIHFCPNCGREMKTCVWKSQDERRHK